MSSVFKCIFPIVKCNKYLLSPIITTIYLKRPKYVILNSNFQNICKNNKYLRFLNVMLMSFVCVYGQIPLLNMFIKLFIDFHLDP